MNVRTYYLYLLECNDESYYIGVTNNIDRRMIEHQQGTYPDCYTYTRRPLALKYFLTFNDINEAIYFEHKIKRWSRAKKESFFEKRWKDLQHHASCKNETSHKLRSSGDETS